VVAAFAAHWRRILRTGRDPAEEDPDFFLAGSDSARERLARSFYGREHARQMASLNEREISKTLAPWLDDAVRYSLDDESMMGDREAGRFLAGLPTGAYVMILHLWHCNGVMVYPYPSQEPVERHASFCHYDDLYERTLGGCSRGGLVRMYKATGERFTRSEARSVRAGIKRELLDGIADAGDDDPWVFTMEAESLLTVRNVSSGLRQLRYEISVAR
jgi:hypothetical protein